MIVLTAPYPVKNEVCFMNDMLEQGLSLLHIRKPSASFSDMEKLIKGIRSEFYPNIVLHQFYDWGKERGILKWHSSAHNLCQAGKTRERIPFFSQSVHTIEEFNSLPEFLNSAFLSPVFPSISKKGYSSSNCWKNELEKRTRFDIKLVALGGMRPQNIQEAFLMGFDDYALMGGLWESGDIIKTFSEAMLQENRYKTKRRK